MSGTVERVPIERAEGIAVSFHAMFATSCSRWLVAGSLRRRCATVGDIEIVCVPYMEEQTAGLFGDAAEGKNLLLEGMDLALATGLVEKRLDSSGRACYGPRHQRLVFNGMAVDVFQVLPPAQWGVIATIRTGPADYSHRLVTPKSYGGCMPYGMSLREGALRNSDGIIETPEEQDFFRALGIDWVPPEERL